jgi:hypothetical protein
VNCIAVAVRSFSKAAAVLARHAAFAALAAVGLAQAVELSPNGYGQALIFPYYTVRSTPDGQFNTYISITNGGWEKAVKLRFREGRSGAQVAEFNLYLSEGDMWTGALVPDPAGVRLVSSDKSCTGPEIPAGGIVLSPPAIDDGQGDPVDRSREGYIEVLAMASFQMPTSLAIDERRCGIREDPAPDGMLPPTGTLAGSATLINVRSARTFGYAAIALDKLAGRPFFSLPYNESAFPGSAFTSTFESGAIDPVSVVKTQDTIYRSTWNRGVDAISAVLTPSSLEGEFVLDPATASKTDWVLTMPTRNAYVRPGLQPVAPFMAQLPDSPCDGAYVLAVSRDATSRPEIFGGVPPPASPLLCWSTSVYSFRRNAVGAARTTDVLGSVNTKTFLSTGSDNGWARFDMSGRVLTALSTIAFSARTGTAEQVQAESIGIPVVGVALTTFDNGFLDCGGKVCKGNFGTAVPLRARRFSAY